MDGERQEMGDYENPGALERNEAGKRWEALSGAVEV